MDIINQMCIILQVVIGVGASFRVIYCLIKIVNNDDEAPSFKKKIKNIIIFLVLSESILEIRDMIIRACFKNKKCTKSFKNMIKYLKKEKEDEKWHCQNVMK